SQADCRKDTGEKVGSVASATWAEAAAGRRRGVRREISWASSPTKRVVGHRPAYRPHEPGRVTSGSSNRRMHRSVITAMCHPALQEWTRREEWLGASLHRFGSTRSVYPWL